MVPRVKTEQESATSGARGKGQKLRLNWTNLITSLFHPFPRAPDVADSCSVFTRGADKWEESLKSGLIIPLYKGKGD